MLAPVRRALETLALSTSLALLGVISLSWTIVALPLLLLLPARPGIWCGRLAITLGFRFYFASLRLVGAYRLDLRGLDGLADGAAVILAPNHPSLIDAALILAYRRNVACILKSALMNNLFLGAGARLARYIRNEPPRRMIAEAVAELRRGGVVLLFPEGTRTTRVPVSPMTASVGIIAKQAGVAVQTLIIEQDSPFLSKGWSLFRRPTLPITYRMRLGRRFDPPANVRAFAVELEEYFRSELAESPQNRWIEARGAVARTAGT